MLSTSNAHRRPDSCLSTFGLHEEIKEEDEDGDDNEECLSYSSTHYLSDNNNTLEAADDVPLLLTVTEEEDEEQLEDEELGQKNVDSPPILTNDELPLVEGERLILETKLPKSAKKDEKFNPSGPEIDVLKADKSSSYVGKSCK